VSWETRHSAESKASAESVWRRYADVTEWAAWSPAIEWARLDGPFEVGGKGKSKARGAPASRFRLERVEPKAGFASSVWLPGARLRFEHIIEPRDPGVLITHRAMLSGPLARLYEKRIRALTEESLREGVERLASTT
jgi:Polyketide cyclase / dehydrase and lipid transport